MSGYQIKTLEPTDFDAEATIRLRCVGSDAQRCFDGLAELVRGGFGEI